MLSLSTARLPSRWRLALAARRGVNRRTSTTAAAAATSFSPQNTPTIPQWRARAAGAAAAPGLANISHRSFSQTTTARESFDPDPNHPGAIEAAKAVEAAKAAKVAARKAAKRDAKLAGTNIAQVSTAPECEPFGPFEDVIQPVALTLWGGKTLEKQGSPRLLYQAEFLGPTGFWRVQIRSRLPQTENHMWKILWRETRPDAYESRKMRKEAEKAAKKGKSKGEDEEEKDGDEENGDVPPLDAVVQDVAKRHLARLAHQKTSEQKKAEAAARLQAVQKSDKQAGEAVDGVKRIPPPPPSVRHAAVVAAEKDENIERSVNITYKMPNPHKDRLPFHARNSMRHFDVCGPVPLHAREEGKSKDTNYVWTDQGGNVLVNHFPLEKLSRMRLTSGLSIIMWKGDYTKREMEAFMSKKQRNVVEREKEAEKAALRAERGRTLPPPSSRTLKNAKERRRQLDLKGNIISTSDGGWAKILSVVARETRKPKPKPKPAGDGSFEKTPHPDIDTIESVWGRRLASLRNPDAVADYAAYLRSRMDAGIVPATVSPRDKAEGDIRRGWQSVQKRKRPHVGDAAKLERKEGRAMGLAKG